MNYLSRHVALHSSGRRVQLAQALQVALNKIEGYENSFVVSLDASENAPTSFIARSSAKLPKVGETSYRSSLLDLCLKEDFELIIPTLDSDLVPLVLNREALRDIGTKLAISSEEAIQISLDKLRLSNHLKEVQILSADTISAKSTEELEPLRFPAFIKPRYGSMSKGARRLNSPVDITKSELSKDFIVQELLTGPEFTVSTYVNRQGKCIVEVPRERIEVRGGEVSKARTVRFDAVEKLARETVESLPGAFGPLNVQIMFTDQGEPCVVEVNARFGGGDPLAWAAGADIPTWLFRETLLGEGVTRFEDWEEGVLMTRFDQAVFKSNRKGIFVG